MSRHINTHSIDHNGPQVIEALGAPDTQGVLSHYRIGLFNLEHHSLDEDLNIWFQRGSVEEAGVNGITEAALLAVLKDRLELAQAGIGASFEKARALEFVDAALRSLLSAQRANVHQ